MARSKTTLKPKLKRAREQLVNGQIPIAIENLRTVLRDHPKQGDALGLLGMAYAQQGKLSEAIPLLQQAHQVLPRDPTIIGNLALALELTGDLEQAVALNKKAIRLQPGNIDLLSNLGDTLRQIGKLEEAESFLRQAITLDPSSVKTWNNMGILLQTRRDYPKAEQALRKGLSLLPNNPSTLNNLAGVLHKQDCYPEAIELLKQALQLQANYQQAWSNLAAAYTMNYQYKEAEQAILQAIELNKDDAASWSNYGKLKHELGEFTEANNCYKRSLELSPDNYETVWHKSLTSLINGDYETGWSEYMAGLSTGDRDPLILNAPIWKNEPLTNKTLFVAAEQGLGDEIMFATCLPDLQETSGNVIYECDPRLRPLFQRSFPLIEFIQRTADSNRNTKTDYQIPSGSIPSFFRKNEDEFPNRQHFLIADTDRIKYWKSRYDALGGGLKIGISWRGGTRVDPLKRSIPLESWRPILETPHCHFIDVQYGDTQVERNTVQNNFGIPIQRFNECDPILEQDDFAAQLCALDLVISVSNATVHLSGALGLPTWSLLPFVPSWRWGAQGNNTSWYPSIALYRQEKMNDWQSVIKNVSVQLSAKLECAQ